MKVEGELDHDDDEEQDNEMEETQRAVERILESVVVKFPVVKNGRFSPNACS